jgi:hypothetical protein
MSQRSARWGSTVKVPDGTDGPRRWRSSVLWTKLSVAFVLKPPPGRWGSKWGGSKPRTRRRPPRLGWPSSAPQSPGDSGRAQVDSVTPVASAAFSMVRRCTPWTTCGGVGIVSISIPPAHTGLVARRSTVPTRPVLPAMRVARHDLLTSTTYRQGFLPSTLAPNVRGERLRRAYASQRSAPLWS